MKPKAFTLIELLVVIVIIGILATISTATFSGYFKKSRDTERQTFINNAHQAIIADQLGKVPDYAFGGVTLTEIEDNLKTLLGKQGIEIPDDKNNISYYYGVVSTPGNSTINVGPSNFMIFVCKEDLLGDITGGPESYAFLESSSDITEVLEEDPGNAVLGDTRMTHPCDTTTSAANARTYFSGNVFGPAATGWLFVNLD